MATKTGTSGSDNLVGTSGADLLRGLAGNDLLQGLGGSDTLEGGTGNDTLEGGTGNDTLSGGDGSDTLFGGGGNDRSIGSAGNDTFDGGTGSDTADYSSLSQAITLLPQGVISKGSLGTDSLSNIERIIGATGRANVIDASSATGSTSLTVNLGTNSLTVNNIPGVGSRSFTVQNFVNVTGTSSSDNIIGNSLNNRLVGNGGSDQISGGSGNDRLLGETGSDQLQGNDGNDSIQGDAGNDSLSGNAGNDNLFGDDGNDTLSGGTGDDRLVGVDFTAAIPPGLGELDTLSGGTGADQFALGDATNIFYDDNNTTNPGFGDLATIQDFSSNGDRIELKGTPEDYLLQSIGGNTRILVDKPGAEQDEIIGIVQGAATLGLDSDDFLFFEGENAGQGTNNTLATAEGLGALSSGSDVNISAQLATVQPGDNPDFDFYTFSLANSGTVTIETSNSGDTVLGLFDSAGTVLQSDDDSGSGVSSLITASLGAGSYSISVSDFAAFPQDGGTFSSDIFNPGPYTLEVSVV